MLYFDLLPMVREAHERDDIETLRRIYGFAEWCSSQSAQDIWNSAAVAFYEHLFDEKRYWTKVVPWLSPEIIRCCWPLWEVRLEPKELDEIQQLIVNRKQHCYRDLECGHPV
jgi:hypothetical protein